MDSKSHTMYRSWESYAKQLTHFSTRPIITVFCILFKRINIYKEVKFKKFLFFCKLFLNKTRFVKIFLHICCYFECSCQYANVVCIVFAWMFRATDTSSHVSNWFKIMAYAMWMNFIRVIIFCNYRNSTC